MLAKPRYEAREALVADGMARFCIFDTFTQSFCAGEAYSSMAKAAVAASRLNGAYERAMAS